MLVFNVPTYLHTVHINLLLKYKFTKLLTDGVGHAIGLAEETDTTVVRSHASLKRRRLVI